MKKRKLFSVLLAVIMVLSTVPVTVFAGMEKGSEKKIYVSDNGNGNGSSVDEAKDFMKAMDEAVDGDTFILVGEVTLPEGWHTPSHDIKITGNDKNTSVLKMSAGGTKFDEKPSMILEGNLTLDNLMLDVEKNPRPYFSSLFVIVSNANKFIIKSGVFTSSDTSYYKGMIFGGAFNEDIVGDTYIENNGELFLTDIYGGGCAGNVTGDTNIIVTGSCVKIYGGGYTVYGVSNTANINGNVNITIQNAQLTSRPIVYGAGNADFADAIVEGNVKIYQDNTKDGGKNIYGAGYANDGNAYVGGNVDITVKNCDLASNFASVYGAGVGNYEKKEPENSKSAGVKGDVSITYENGNFGYIFGAGEEYADVDGKTTINIKNVKGTPHIYGGGKGTDKNKVQSNGKVEINILNTLVELYTQGEYAQVNETVTVNLLGGGADRKVNSLSSDLYNRMAVNDNESIGNENFRAVVNILEGENIITTINDFDSVNIKKGSLLEHVTYYDGSGTSGDGERKLLNNIADINIENGGCLDLLQDNEIKGSFKSKGNLTTVAGAKLIVDKTVESGKGASYTSSNADESYNKSYAFLQAKEDLSPTAQFDSADNNYFVANRTENIADGIKREWYLNKDEVPVITASDKELTVGDDFNPLDDVSATDKEDGIIELTQDNVAENTVDTTQAGEYSVTYIVTDSYGHTVTKTIKVTVKNRTYSVTYQFESETDGKELPQEVEKLLPVDEQVYIEGTVVKPVDLETLSVKVDNGVWKFTGWDAESKTVDKDTVFIGTWRFDKNAELINHAPNINAEDKELTVGDDFNPLDDVSATDNEDGDITDNIEVAENTADTSKAGTYYVTYKVTDKDGASVVKTVKVTVKDKNASVTPIDPTNPTEPSEPSKPNNTDNSNISPQTGENSIMLWVVLTVLSITALSITVVFFRKKKHIE